MDISESIQDILICLDFETNNNGCRGEGTTYGNLGNVFYSLGEYQNAKEYHEKALAIAIEIGDRRGEGTTYENLG